MMSDTGLLLLQIAVAITMAVGLVGLIIPVLPGLTIIWAASLVYGLVTGFTWQSALIFALLTLIMLAGNLADNFIMGASARAGGASWLSIVIALIAGVIGTLLLPPIGGILAALLGIFVVEVIRMRGDWRKALEAARNIALGCGGAVIVRSALGMLMILLWVVWAFLLK
ncbi:MAG: DUF456 domain-containing protein [Anaerolineae bacterium]|nr:DUF456 domain-containing protein [Anaerolineae bacterium]